MLFGMMIVVCGRIRSLIAEIISSLSARHRARSTAWIEHDGTSG